MRKTRLSLGAAAVALAIAAVVLAAVAPPGLASGEDERNDGQTEAVALPEKAGLRYPNLGSGLDRLASGVEGGRMAAESAAAQPPVHLGGSVAVTIHLSGGADEVVSFLEEHGGDPRNVGEDYVEAYVPVTLLGRLSEQPGVIRVREIVPPQPVQITQTVAGNGPGVHGSLAWNRAGYSGYGVKVGIIDDFRGLASLMGTELPTRVHGRCYTDIGVFTDNLADCESVDEVSVRIPECLDYARRVAVLGAEHGTIVAESLIDIAPEASLYIANPKSKGDLQNAVDWMTSQGVQVINYSVGWTFDGPGDGTSPTSASPLRAVDRAVASDVIWVNAAGNDADGTWFGGYSDPDGDGVLGFGGGNDEALNVSVRECRTYRVQLRWEDKWYGASTDLDLYLYDTRTGEYIPTIRSTEEQSGGSGHVPYETIWFRAAIDSNDLGIVVGHYGGDIPDWIQLVVWGQGVIQHYTGSGGITNPSESANPGMLAVGAAHWNDVRAIEPYSSRGPTPDGRVKPDIVGADCGATALTPLDEYNQGFCGTSQAAPHVAGLAALVRQRFPSYTPAEVVGYLKDSAEQREGPDPNHTWGHGFAKLPPPAGTTPPTPPTLSNAFTRNPAVDLGSLMSAGNTWPDGIWSDGETMWVADWLDVKIYAYDMTTGERLPAGDFDTLSTAGNTWPGGIWSDGETMWVADWLDVKVYAYDMATKAPLPGMDFDTLEGATNVSPSGIWSDGETMWVADWSSDKIYAYDMATKAPLPGMDFDALKGARNGSPHGIWSDGTTMWVADWSIDKIYAYDMATKARVSRHDFNTLITAANFAARGIWSDGETMWVADSSGGEIYAYHMPQSDREVLIALSEASGGAGWTNNANWLTKRHIGQWHGVTADGSGRVTALDLTDNGLSGMIPAQLGSLSNLEQLDLGGNELTGEVPEQLGSLSNLEQLHLRGNKLTGELPQALTGLTVLQEFSFHLNTGLCAPVDGAFQAWLGGMAVRGSSCAPADSQEDRAVLVQLHGDMDGGNWADRTNWLSERPIREWYGVTSDADGRVTGLYLGHNQLSGEVPASLGSLANLERLRLDGNGLSGEIPAELGSLAYLEVLRLSGNRLTGCVPSGVREALEDDFDELGLPLCGPSVTLTAARSAVRLGAPISVTATFTSEVSGFTVDDITVANGAADGFSGNGAVYTFDVTPNAVGPVTVDVAAGVAEDAGGRANTAAVRLGLGLPYDDDGDGAIEKSEVIRAITDYLFGDGSVSKAQVIGLITLYLFGPA